MHATATAAPTGRSPYQGRLPETGFATVAAFFGAAAFVADRYGEHGFGISVLDVAPAALICRVRRDDGSCFDLAIDPHGSCVLLGAAE